MSRIEFTTAQDLLDRKVIGMVQSTANAPLQVELDETADPVTVRFFTGLDPRIDHGSMTLDEMERLTTFEIMDKLKITRR